MTDREHADSQTPSIQGSVLGWSLTVLLREWSALVEDISRELPQGVRGYQVLSAAVHEPPRSQLALAQRLGIDRTVMTYLIDDLTAAGLIERQPDPTDRRARRLVATDAGRAELRKVERALRRAEGEALAPLDDDERAAFRALLCRIARHSAQSA